MNRTGCCDCKLRENNKPFQSGGNKEKNGWKYLSCISIMNGIIITYCNSLLYSPLITVNFFLGNQPKGAKTN